jgi:sec-independent protein translocase protein TatB
MFEIGWGELVVIGIVALIAIGPKELPGVLRSAGQWMGKIRRMASEFQDQFKEAMREAEMDDLKKKVDEMTDTAKSYTNFDPIGTVRNEIEKAVGEPPSLDGKPSEPAVQASPSEASPVETGTAEAPPAPQPEPTDGRKAGEGA